MIRKLFLHTERGRTAWSWCASMLAHVAAGAVAILGVQTIPLEFGVALGRPVQVELSSRAQMPREQTSEPEPVVEVTAPVKEELLTEPPNAEPLHPRNLEVVRSATGVDVQAERKPLPMESAAVESPRRSQLRPEARPDKLPEHKLKTTHAPRRATLQPDTVSAMASVALEQSTFGASVDQMPHKLASNASPVYPLDALLAGMEGRVVLRVLVTADGRVARVEVSRSSGVASLDASALTAIESWRFSPARRGGVAVEYEVLVPVKFSIRRG